MGRICEVSSATVGRAERVKGEKLEMEGRGVEGRKEEERGTFLLLKIYVCTAVHDNYYNNFHATAWCLWTLSPSNGAQVS